MVKFRKVFEQARPTNIAIDGVKTLAQSLKTGPPRKHQMSHRAYVTFYDDADDVIEDGEIDDVHAWAFKFQVMGSS